MKKTKLFLLLVLLALPGLTLAKPVEWVRELNEETFRRAKEENRLVLLNLEAVWCHWCHVMDEKTYSQESIRELLDKRYITVRIDQDARPDLGNRFREYGWPATIIFKSTGEELEKLAGFVEPAEMEKILRDQSENPRPSEEKRVLQYSDASSLPPGLKAELIRRFDASADKELGGLKTSHKYLEVETVEFGLSRAMRGNVEAENFVKRSLESNKKLFDPVWGGVYQYSTHRDWDHPHFEKLAAKQADVLRIYAKAYALWNDPSYLALLQNVRKYLSRFLQDPASGVFYTSQDADVVRGEHSEEFFKLADTERLKVGIPAIDKNIYSSENGKIISAYVDVYKATKDATALHEAIRAARWIVLNRQTAEGGFRHGESDSVGGPYLCDSLYMGSALLNLYSATGERSWLIEARRSADFIERNFSPIAEQAGFVTAKAGAGVFRPRPLLVENIEAVRFFAALYAYTGEEKYRFQGGLGMRLLGTERIALDSITEIGIVLADEELNQPLLHVTVVGAKEDPSSLALFQAALAYPEVTKRSEWWDRKEGPMPNPDIQYPPQAKAAAFVCTNQRCSLPILTPSGVLETIRKLSAPSS